MSARRFVLDNSVVIAWGLSEGSEYADEVIERLIDGEALVPSVWPLEFGNALLVAERRRRITEAESTRLRQLIQSLPIAVVPESVGRILSDVLQLARERSLSVYDASYLDLAMREGVPLATLDERMREAAKRCSVPLLGVT